MKFSELKNSSKSEAEKLPMSEYLRSYLREDRLKKIDEIRDRYVYHLFKDLAKTEAPFNFNTFLNTYYADSNNHAGDCIRKSLYVKDLLPRDIKYWTEGALKCFDYFLLIYVQDVRKETIPNFATRPKETDVYNHLISKGGTEQKIGEAFKYIYQYRSSFYHIQHVASAGRREIVKTSNKKYKQTMDVIINFFNQALSNFKIFEHTITTT
ncbi:hypothetical protein BH11BAC3_BH11BAC3_07510 [soil metagenome]